jgi:hypothetical protein
MKTKRSILIALLALTSNCFSQQNAAWSNWLWLTGEWKGEGNGQPGQGGGTFSFNTDLNEHIMVRKSHSEYPANGNRPATVHDDLMIVSLDFTGNATKAIYFDNEGHTINYSITYAPKTIVLLSDKIPNVPVFRLTYTLLEDQRVNTKFEMSQDGEKFMTYIEGLSTKVK